MLRRVASPDGVGDHARTKTGQQDNSKCVRPDERAGHRSNVPHLGERGEDTSHTYEHGNHRRDKDGDFLHFIPFGYHDSIKQRFI